MQETIGEKRQRSISNVELIKNDEKNLIISAKKRIKDEDFSILNIENYENLEIYNYKMAHLKTMLKYYKLRVSGTKRELRDRLHEYLKKSYYAIKIQRNIRKHIVVLWKKSKGPALFKRSMCTNETDFFTLESVKTMDINQFISFKEDNFVYGFDICSINELFKISSIHTQIENPFTRNKMSMKTHFLLKRSIQLQKCLHMNVKEDVEKEEIQDIYSNENIHHRVVEIFSKIDNLGNYSDVNWFLALDKTRLIRYIRELHDIWHYRAQLAPNVKKNICFPLGNPFSINVNYLTDADSKNYVQYYTLDIINNFITKGITQDDKSLGAFYVLSAFTLVSNDAAHALPWLYESVSHMANF
jgi:hypothetical protein